MKKVFLPAVFVSFAVVATNLAAEPKDGGTAIKEGALVQGTGAVFLIRDGVRWGIPTPEVFQACGFKGQDVVHVSDQELQAVPEGPILTAPLKPTPYKTVRDGDLIQALVEEDGRFKPAGPVFLIRGDVRCGFPTGKVFSDRGFKAESVIFISEEDMSNIPVGGILD